MSKKAEEFGVKPGDIAIVQGEVVFSSLTKKDTRQTPNSHIKQEPNYNISIVNPVVKSGAPAMKEFVESKFYVSKSGQHQGQTQFTARSTGKFAPRIFDTVVRKPNGDPADAILTGGELAAGQTVQVMINAFDPKKYDNVGTSLSGVLVKDLNNIQYYNNAGSNVAAFGFQPNPNAPASLQEPAPQAQPQTPQANPQLGNPAQFGQPNATQNQGFGVNPAAQPQTQAGAFGAQTAANQPQNGAFGQPPVQPNTFGAQPTAPQTPQNGAFGTQPANAQPNAPQNGAFGTQPANTQSNAGQGNAFGQQAPAAPQGDVFGNPAPTANPSQGAFGSGQGAFGNNNGAPTDAGNLTDPFNVAGGPFDTPNGNGFGA